VGTIVATDRGFHEHFTIDSDDDLVFDDVWTDDTKLVMRRQFSRSTIAGGGDNVTLIILESTDDAAQLEVGIRLVAELARADVVGRASLRSILGAVEVPDERGFPTVKISGPSDVVVGQVALGERIVTRARAVAPAGDRDALVRVEDGAITDALADRILTDEQLHLARTVGTADLEMSSDEVCLTWLAIEDDVARLEAGVALVRSLVAPPEQGVFR
jgi:hypothetical protein